MEKLNGLMGHSLKDTFKKMKEQAKEKCIGKMGVFIWESGQMINTMAGAP